MLSYTAHMVRALLVSTEGCRDGKVEEVDSLYETKMSLWSQLFRRDHPQ